VRHYWAYCSSEDALLGLVLDALDATGQAERTLVVRTADHGDYAGAHGLFLKGVPAFQEAYRVPMIVRWPDGMGPGGNPRSELVTLADICPTLLELAEVDPPTRLTGRSLVPLLRGTAVPDWPDAVHTQLNGVELYYTQRSVTTATHRYVFNGFDFDELYDLRVDPRERHNLSEDPAHREVKRELVARMWRFAEQEEDDLVSCQYPPVALAPWGPGDDPEERP
jgi:arylsulfatase A-like enzyme